MALTHDAFVFRGPERADQDYAVIASTPRSGTTYITALLQKLGVRVGHENVFTSAGSHLDPPDWLTVEVSGFAGLHPFTNTGPVLHQIRSPLAVVSSLVATNVLRITDPESVAAWYVNVFTHNQAAADFTYRIEDMDIHLAHTVCQWIGHEPVMLEAALMSTPRDLNTRPKRTLTLPELGWYAPAVELIMRDYGYGP